MLSSASMSGLFREIDARRPTWGFDEFDKQIGRRLAGAPRHPQLRAPQNLRLRHQDEKTPDGQFVTEKFSTFTAMAFSGMKKLPDAMTSRCIIVSLQRAGAHDKLEHLVDGASEKLTEIRRKLARWAKDVTDCRGRSPARIGNRLGDNWYTIRQIGKLAGDAWYQRAMAAAINADHGGRHQHHACPARCDLARI